jgi:hypothetical protein
MFCPRRHPLLPERWRIEYFVDYRQLATFAQRNAWQVPVFDTGTMVYFEEVNAFVNEYEGFLAQIA